MSGPSLEQAAEWSQGITPRELSDSEAAGLLPTPTAAMGSGGNERRGGDRGDELLLAGLVKTFLPTPTKGDEKQSGSSSYAVSESHHDGLTLTDATQRGLVDWATYGPAIRLHELIVADRAAPAPLNDAGQLSPAFVEWMMGLPEGHVTGVPGLSRAQQLARLGNGVVPQQAAAAIAGLAARFELEAVAA